MFLQLSLFFPFSHYLPISYHSQFSSLPLFFFLLDLYTPLQMPVYVRYKPNIFIFKAHKCYVY